MSIGDAARAMAIIAVSATTSALAVAPVPTARSAIVAIMSDIDQRFICPEFLPDDAARAADLAAFAQTLSTIRPQPAPAQIRRVRSILMERHNCSRVAVASEAPAAAPTPASSSTPVSVASAAVPSVPN